MSSWFGNNYVISMLAAASVSKYEQEEVIRSPRQPDLELLYGVQKIHTVLVLDNLHRDPECSFAHASDSLQVLLCPFPILRVSHDKADTILTLIA